MKSMLQTGIKVYHIRLTKEVSQWAIPSMTTIAELMMQQTCLIFFYNAKEQLQFHGFMLRKTKGRDFEKKHVAPSLWAYCNKNDKAAMAAMLKLPKLTKFVRIAPLVDKLIETGQVQVIATEDADAISKKYYKSDFFAAHKKMLTTYAKEDAYIVEIIN